MQCACAGQAATAEVTDERVMLRSAVVVGLHSGSQAAGCTCKQTVLRCPAEPRAPLCARVRALPTWQLPAAALPASASWRARRQAGLRFFLLVGCMILAVAFHSIHFHRDATVG